MTDKDEGALQVIQDGYRRPALLEEEEVKKHDPGLSSRVWDAMNATLGSLTLSPLSHYQDHVQCRWGINLRRALDGSDDFIWADESWGERYTLQTVSWRKFFWATRRMSWAKRFRWIAERLETHET